MEISKHDTLFRHLLNEASCYENLQETARNKQDAIVAGDIKRLRLATDMEQSLVKKGKQLTDERCVLLKEALGSAIGSDEINLSAFIAKAPSKNRRDWNFLKNRIKNAATVIQQLNHENAMLLHTSIRFVTDLVQLMYPKDKLKSGMYGADGTANETAMHMVDYGV